jgi:hypothetical protein
MTIPQIDDEMPEYIESALGDFVYPDQDSYWEMLPQWRQMQREGD